MSDILMKRLMDEQDRSLRWVELLSYAIAEFKQISSLTDHPTGCAIADEAVEHLTAEISKMNV